MDSNKILIGAVVLIVAFLAFPIVAKKMKGDSASSGAAGGAAASAGTGAAAATSAAGEGNASKFPGFNDPPLLNEGNLTGTEWSAPLENYKVKVTLAPGGVLYLSHPMAKALTGMDYIEGRWTVNGNKIMLVGAMAGQEKRIEIHIGGNNLYFVKNNKVSKVEKF